MRFFYFILKCTLKYALRIFYPRQKLVNSPNEYFGRTIYVSNHAASFMDPLIVAGLRKPIVFFMTRSDVFTPVTRPILWAAHMFPIYRQHDGEDTKKKNEEVFKKCARVLSFGRNLLIFGEGFTDDTFIRRLKPVKKGAIRIGFTSLEQMNWKKKVYVAAVGCNYTDPNQMRSDILVSTSDKFCLNDYREEYEANPNKVINDLTKKVESMMKDQITHIEDKNQSELHENTMRITRKGMNAINSDKSIPLIERWKYSKRLAEKLNSKTIDPSILSDLDDQMKTYFDLLKKENVDENFVYEVETQGKLSTSKEILFLITMWPFALLGLIHCGLPYYFIVRFVEKSFKRRVFWGSVKLLLGMIGMGLLNIPFIFIIPKLIYPSIWVGLAYYSLIGLFGLAAYLWFKKFALVRAKKSVDRKLIMTLCQKRKIIETSIDRVFPEV